MATIERREERMTWYAAHLVEYFKVLEGPQSSFLCYERVILIEAENEKRAYEEAERLGRAHAEKERDLDIEERGHPLRPAKGVFAGVRKLIECQHVSPETPSGGPFTRSGTEITYSRFIVDTEEAAQALAKGEAATVLYEE
ncbi:MAG TPA: DUF4288 domain-containing protein [Chloroflexota bacterium]|nr:DUF4288 domain-containing protein [Chloroflexota bacterium]